MSLLRAGHCPSTRPNCWKNHLTRKCWNCQPQHSFLSLRSLAGCLPGRWKSSYHVRPTRMLRQGGGGHRMTIGERRGVRREGRERKREERKPEKGPRSRPAEKEDSDGGRRVHTARKDRLPFSKNTLSPARPGLALSKDGTSPREAGQQRTFPERVLDHPVLHRPCPRACSLAHPGLWGLDDIRTSEKGMKRERGGGGEWSGRGTRVTPETGSSCLWGGDTWRPASYLFEAQLPHLQKRNNNRAATVCQHSARC